MFNVSFKTEVEQSERELLRLAALVVVFLNKKSLNLVVPVRKCL